MLAPSLLPSKRSLPLSAHRVLRAPKHTQMNEARIHPITASRVAASPVASEMGFGVREESKSLSGI
eukprot:m.77437 g.77437  ORF g.77437 m.77437 type:complete len:66 (+) comp8136_c1_seq2:520-717(+)